jgi:membrane-associated phospholipid phosphatase
MLLWLLLLRAPRAAGWWLAAVGFCVGLTGILKIFFFGCPPIVNLHSPSGHTSLSTLLYGALALVIAVDGGNLRLLMVVGGGAGLIFTIAASRLLLDAHSMPEIASGLVIGVAALILFGQGYLRWRPEIVRLSPLLVSAAVLMSTLHGSQLRAEEFLHRITGSLHIHCG